MPPASLHPFDSVRWSAALLSDPDFALTPSSSRILKAGTTEDAFFSTTLQTDTTIRNFVSLYRVSGAAPEGAGLEVRVLLDVGRGGVDGYAGICHGGFVATILDEVMGAALGLNQEMEAAAKGRSMRRMLTASLDIKYRRPVPTPTVLMVKGLLGAETVKGDGRRARRVRATVEDGMGGVYAEGECLFVELKESPVHRPAKTESTSRNSAGSSKI